MGRCGLCHQLLRADVVKSNFQQCIAAHFHDRQHHTLTKGSVGDHITLVQFQVGSLGIGRRRGNSGFRLGTGGNTVVIVGGIGRIGISVAAGIAERRLLCPAEAALANNAILGNFF